MQKSTSTLPARRPSPDHLMRAPLDDLLAEHRVDVSVVEAEPGFTGGTYVRADGSLLFVRPAGRPCRRMGLIWRCMTSSRSKFKSAT